MVEGRSFTQDFGDDSVGIFLINETAARRMQLDKPVGAQMCLTETFRGTIVGVFEDFHYNTARTKINPMTLVLERSELRHAYVRFLPGHLEEGLAYARKVWGNLEKDYPFEYEFTDETLQSLYAPEKRMSVLFRFFTGFAILISCLGLFGLASFMTEQRQKEIGIRKVMGGRVDQLVLLLTREFTRWVILAGVVGLPLSYFAMQRWLQAFYYRISPGVNTLFLSFFLALAVAVLTVSIQTYRASVRNPADTLRDE
jgi:putative ABC transport system permease protein